MKDFKGMAEAVEYFNTAKDAIVTANYVTEYGHAPMRAKAIEIHMQAFSAAKQDKTIEEKYAAVQAAIDWKSSNAVRLEMEAICTELGGDADAYYCAAGYGKFWNEVELPMVVRDLFCGYVKTLSETTEGMIEVESCTAYSIGTVGVSYYDLSDILVVFKDETAVRNFLAEEKNQVDPVDVLYYTDGAWYCE